jgi:pimeloyl-ACP methyl ester carboxylesterase
MAPRRNSSRARIATSLLEVAYETGGPQEGPPVLLIHGWPDDVRAFDGIAPALQAAGFRTFTPWLRGFGPTRFLAEETPRSGQTAALAADMIEFADALGLGRFAIVGHDWGARIAYFLAAILPERVERIAALSVGWEPGGFATPGLTQARAFWYQWFMATDRGAAVVREKGRDFARFQWETWSPSGWFGDADFAATAAAFDNPDWSQITLHSYRVRWGEAVPDPRYAALEERQKEVRQIAVPTLMIQGGDDRCVLPASTEGKARHFAGPYRRVVLEGVGHFPTREAPREVGKFLVEFLKEGQSHAGPAAKGSERKA